ncbi:hypothetical protein ASF13_00605 [Erwinia sp. Leaf53]|nr:hypothetical protein ASF13_00605 [Erwinia sp. Leaf53]
MMTFLRKWLKNRIVLSCLIYLPLILLIIFGISMAYMLANVAMLVLAVAVVLIVVFSVSS